MTSKYDTDSYSVTTFDERGRKLLKMAMGNVGLVKATEWAREQVQSGAAHSFVVERVLINSMDDRRPWSAAGRFADGKPYEGQ